MILLTINQRRCKECFGLHQQSHMRKSENHGNCQLISILYQGMFDSTETFLQFLLTETWIQCGKTACTDWFLLINIRFCTAKYLQTWLHWKMPVISLVMDWGMNHIGPHAFIKTTLRIGNQPRSLQGYDDANKFS